MEMAISQGLIDRYNAGEFKNTPQGGILGKLIAKQQGGNAGSNIQGSPAKQNLFTGTQVDKGENVESRVARIASQDSALMRLAKRQADNRASARGLINTSLASGSAVDAVLSASTPIAKADATDETNRNIAQADIQKTLNINNLQDDRERDIANLEAKTQENLEQVRQEGRIQEQEGRIQEQRERNKGSIEVQKLQNSAQLKINKSNNLTNLYSNAQNEIGAIYRNPDMSANEQNQRVKELLLGLQQKAGALGLTAEEAKAMSAVYYNNNGHRQIREGVFVKDNPDGSITYVDNDGKPLEVDDSGEPISPDDPIDFNLN